MATIISTLDNAITYINTLYNNSSTPPSSGEEDYTVWTSLLNVAISLWENEEGMLWNELFVRSTSAPDGDFATVANDYSYACPTLFRFPASGYVWLGTGTGKKSYKVIKPEEKQLYEINSGPWCYFLQDGSPTLEFNPNVSMIGGETITYSYYKKASALSSGSDTFEMSDPMFAVYYVIAELKKEEGNANELQIAMQKLNAMKTRNVMPAWYQQDSFINVTESGFGV